MHTREAALSFPFIPFLACERYDRMLDLLKIPLNCKLIEQRERERERREGGRINYELIIYWKRILSKKS